MRSVFLALATVSTLYFLWSCKVRLAEQSSVAASESELAKQKGVTCASKDGGYPRLSDVTVDPDHAALRFTLEDKTSQGSTFRFRYFTHATKYYDPSQQAQFYAVRLGDNLLDFEANDSEVRRIWYKPNGNPVELTCS